MHESVQLFIDKQLDLREKNEYQNTLRFKRMELEENIIRLEDVQRLNESTVDYVGNFMADPAKMWLDSPHETKVLFQQIIFPDGITFDARERKFGTVLPSVLYRWKDIIKDPSESEESLMVISPGIEPGLPG